MRLRAEMLGRLASHPVAKRLLANYRKYGRAGAEIYTQHDDGTGNPRYFDVLTARLWCDKRKQIEPLEFSEDLVRELSSNGGIDLEHLASKQFDKEVAPVIFLRGATIGGLLIDGAHRYVAFARDAQKRGIRDSIRWVPAYILDPQDWKRFVVPPAVAKAFQFDSQGT